MVLYKDVHVCGAKSHDPILYDFKCLDNRKWGITFNMMPNFEIVVSLSNISSIFVNMVLLYCCCVVDAFNPSAHVTNRRRVGIFRRCVQNYGLEWPAGLVCYLAYHLSHGALRLSALYRTLQMRHSGGFAPRSYLPTNRTNQL